MIYSKYDYQGQSATDGTYCYARHTTDCRYTMYKHSEKKNANAQALYYDLYDNSQDFNVSDYVGKYRTLADVEKAIKKAYRNAQLKELLKEYVKDKKKALKGKSDTLDRNLYYGIQLEGDFKASGKDKEELMNRAKAYVLALSELLDISDDTMTISLMHISEEDNDNGFIWDNCGWSNEFNLDILS